MLHFVSAVGILRNGGTMWSDALIAQVSLYQIYRDYTSVVVKIHDDVANVNGWVDLYQLPYVLRSSPQTCDQYFATGAAIRYMAEEPNWDDAWDTVKFYFANAFGYRLRGVNANFDVNEPLLPGQQVDCLLSHPKVTKASVYDRMYHNCLFTVDGLIHHAGYSPDGMYLYEAGKTIYRHGDNRVGVLDFEALGGVTTRHLTDADFIYPTAEKKLSQVVYIDFPDTLEGQSVFLVCGGTLFLEDSPISVVSSNRVKIDLRKLNLKELYYDNWRTMDFSECPLTRDPRVEDQLVQAEFITDPVLRWFLTYVNTFLVLVPRPEITVRMERLNHTDQCGIYRHYIKHDLQLPIAIGRRRIGEYNVQQFDGYYMYSVPYYWLEQKVWRDTTFTDQDGLNIGIMRDQLNPHLPRRDAAAYLVRIQSPHVES